MERRKRKHNDDIINKRSQTMVSITGYVGQELLRVELIRSDLCSRPRFLAK